ncbi:MAG: carboxypeptidase-like regulatory domain-containing protein, partial [Saprospiraceae bacterium]
MKYFFLCCCCVLYSTTQSQTITKISGSVASLKEGALAGATVLLIADKSDETIKATFSDVDGKFEFEQVKVLSARIVVQYLGYQKYTSELFTFSEETLTIPPITLKESAAELQEISVTARIPFAVKKLDRIVVNPAALISNVGLTALEVLEKAPLVSVDYDGNISLRGKSGILVLIDDRPSYLSEAELASYLRSIPASSIETIEVMTNPPAKYDASGNAGVINIRLKRNIAKGFNGG